jgi:hypothetical protein
MAYQGGDGGRLGQHCRVLPLLSEQRTNEKQPLQPRNKSDLVTLDQRTFLSWETKNHRHYNNIPSGFFRGCFHSRDETTGGERLPIFTLHKKLQRRALKLPRAGPLVLRPLRGEKQWSAKQDTWDFCKLQTETPNRNLLPTYCSLQMQEQASHLRIQAPQSVEKKNCDITGVDREIVLPT